MSRYIINLIIVLFIVSTSFGQTPNWSVDENKFQYTMSFVSFLNINGTELSSQNDKIAAFFGEECRGVANLTYVESEKRFYAFLTVFSNDNNENLRFKIYDSTNDKVVDVKRSKKFEINGHFGDLFQSYSFADPALSSEAEVLDFNFKDISINDKIINDSSIDFFFDQEIDISQLVAIFELSPGAKLYVGSMLQTSGESAINYSQAVEFTVLSEDRSITKTWTIIANLSYGEVSFYKKDAVCYAGGAIQVKFSQNGEDVFLIRNGETIAAQSIIGGEAAFYNLETATYKVRVAGHVKNISINVKQ